MSFERRIYTNKFWNWCRDADTSERVLYLDGIIGGNDTWFEDDITPAAFKAELLSGTGDVTIWLNSAGGDCIAASQIYSMLMDYKGHITVKIDGIAASAASVVAMAGTDVFMVPTSLIMIHNPFSVAIGDSEEMRKTMDMLSEVKDSIINAYQIKTGLSRTKLSNMMDAETWMNSNKAVELGFADGILEDEKKRAVVSDTYVFSRRAVTNSLISKLQMKVKTKTGTPIESLDKRLSLITH